MKVSRGLLLFVSGFALAGTAASHTTGKLITLYKTALFDQELIYSPENIVKEADVIIRSGLVNIPDLPLGSIDELDSISEIKINRKSVLIKIELLNTGRSLEPAGNYRLYQK
jgi:hypothetical protein